MQEKVGYLHESQWIQGKVLKRRKVQDFMLLCERKQTFFFFSWVFCMWWVFRYWLNKPNWIQGTQLQAKKRRCENPKLTKMKFLLLEGIELAMKKWISCPWTFGTVIHTCYDTCYVHFQGKPFNITGIQVHDPTSNAEKAEAERFYESLQDLLELTPKKDVLFIIGDWNAKVGSQEILGVTGKFDLVVQNKAGQRLTEFGQENTQVIANTLFQWHKRRLYTWTSPDGQYWNQIDYILCSQRWRSSIQSAKVRLGADWLRSWTYCKIQLKLTKVGKTIRPSRYDLNQIPYDYTMEVTNRFKGLDLIDRVPEELWMELWERSMSGLYI